MPLPTIRELYTAIIAGLKAEAAYLQVPVDYIDRGRHVLPSAGPAIQVSVEAGSAKVGESGLSTLKRCAVWAFCYSEAQTDATTAVCDATEIAERTETVLRAILADLGTRPESPQDAIEYNGENANYACVSVEVFCSYRSSAA